MNKRLMATDCGDALISFYIAARKYMKEHFEVFCSQFGHRDIKQGGTTKFNRNLKIAVS